MLAVCANVSTGNDMNDTTTLGRNETEERFKEVG